MSYRGSGVGQYTDPWTAQKAAEFEAAMQRTGGMGATAIERQTRAVALPASRSIAIPGLAYRRSLGQEPPPAQPPNVGLMVGFGLFVAGAAGVLWYATRKPVRANRPGRKKGRRSRRRLSRNPTFRGHAGKDTAAIATELRRHGATGVMETTEHVVFNLSESDVEKLVSGAKASPKLMTFLLGAKRLGGHLASASVRKNRRRRIKSARA